LTSVSPAKKYKMGEKKKGGRKRSRIDLGVASQGTINGRRRQRKNRRAPEKKLYALSPNYTAKKEKNQKRPDSA